MKARAAVRGLKSGVYLLPSLFTVGNMLLGFGAVVVGLEGAFQKSALMIFAAAVLDSLDGRIARLTQTESEFGKEFDSLADVLTFGMVPALLAYIWGLKELGRIGWLIPLFYLVCASVRLARFNIQQERPENRDFVGLPSPAAAGVIASFLIFAPDRDWKAWLDAVMICALVGAGLLMVSTFRYSSFKHIDLRRRLSYRMVLPGAIVLLVAAYHPIAFFLALAWVYSLTGPSNWALERLQGIRPSRRKPSNF